ncbi:hypothetical protein [Pseudonocardia sp. HH130630-07]|uniref:hypothetical protein n=1 Tax=Pseudonocardia sp. HH130630-07 TaxID=1690815 RepID=UPI000814BC38|nr:hypothetical protein [Pseudonocardia sp. HH130630-07]ANY07457.1 hypothetical protein AFB00_15450 [Pseudonocardia sp. HH130630-07]
MIELLSGAATTAAAFRAARSPDAPTRWAAAVALGGTGHYAAAAAVLDRLRRDPGVGPAVRAHAGVTRASHLRQLGGHRLAEPLDAAALALARPVAGDRGQPWGTGATAAVGDALTGLAADAVGRADARTAAALLARAEPWCGPAGTRCRIRYDWVAAETALVAGDPAGALAAADAAVAGAVALGSARHLLKSGLVRAVSAGVAGADPGTVLAELDAVALAALGSALPLHRPALLAAADLARRHGWSRPVPPGARVRHAGSSRFDTRSRRTDAEGRRHAGLHTVSVLYTRSDGIGRDLLRDSRPQTRPDDVP